LFGLVHDLLLLVLLLFVRQGKCVGTAGQRAVARSPRHPTLPDDLLRFVVCARPTTGAIRCCCLGLARPRCGRDRARGGCRGAAASPPCRPQPSQFATSAGAAPLLPAGAVPHDATRNSFPYRRTTGPEGAQSGRRCVGSLSVLVRERTQIVKDRFRRGCIPPGIGPLGRHRQTKSPGRISRNPGFLGESLFQFSLRS
jgi:hypothetical protein